MPRNTLWYKTQYHNITSQVQQPISNTTFQTDLQQQEYSHLEGRMDNQDEDEEDEEDGVSLRYALPG